jgi:hypothetical protein
VVGGSLGSTFLAWADLFDEVQDAIEVRTEMIQDVICRYLGGVLGSVEHPEHRGVCFVDLTTYQTEYFGVVELLEVHDQATGSMVTVIAVG